MAGYFDRPSHCVVRQNGVISYADSRKGSSKIARIEASNVILISFRKYRLRDRSIHHHRRSTQHLDDVDRSDRPDRISVTALRTRFRVYKICDTRNFYEKSRQ